MSYSSKRMNIKMRMVREISLWVLFAHDFERLKYISPFDQLDADLLHWRADQDVWRFFFSQVKPKERAIKLWRQDQLWKSTYKIACGVLKYQTSLDTLISRSSLHWRLHRMSGIDRNILRLASYELCFCDEIPARAILNEAIELGKRYGSNDSGRFINGVIDRIAHDLGRVQSKIHARQKTKKIEVFQINKQSSTEPSSASSTEPSSPPSTEPSSPSSKSER